MEAIKGDTFTLTVVRVDGNGNTGGGNYFYSFSPSSLMLTTPGFVHFKLSSDTSKGIRIFAVVDNGSSGQLQPAKIAKSGKTAKMFDSVTAGALIDVAVVVTDDHAKEEKYIVCDPQVINVPD
ncbi:hypothetical protein [Stenotrophomonas sp.]|uniref:hypothetical protein n=1 Tax=Stenotrophomonas sp. TaxID=69392 RepID=UPI0028A87BB6|nr:hypothetical protein [Stenotrophomonas sp.]